MKPPLRPVLHRSSSKRDQTEALPLTLRLHPGSNPVLWRAAGGAATCRGCVAHCCRYVAVEIDRPRAGWQYDQIYWMLLHDSVAVYVNRRGKWFVEFQTRCHALDDKNRCSIYDERPGVCREYEVETCPVWGVGEAHRMRFESAEEFQDYLARVTPRSRPRARGRARSAAGGRAPARSPRH